MSKRSLDFHKECLVNQLLSIGRAKAELAVAQSRVDRLCREAAFLQRQIEQAEVQNKDSFDPERFLVKKTQS